MQNEPLGMFGTLMWLWNNWDYLMQLWNEIIIAFTSFVGTVAILASVITPLTKTPKDDEALAWVKNWLHQFSFTNAKNVKGIGQQPAAPPPVPPQNTELPIKR